MSGFPTRKQLHPKSKRQFAMKDIANVGFSEKENIVAVRTRNDDREVYVWMASAEEARALLALLPRTTTPEFLEQQQLRQKFRENLKAIAPRAPVTPTIIGINVAVFLLMLAAGAGLGAASGTMGVRFGGNYGPLTWGGEPWRLLTSAFVHSGIVHICVQHVCAVLRWHVDRAPLWQRTFRRDLPAVGAGRQRGEQLLGTDARERRRLGRGVWRVRCAARVRAAAARRYSARSAEERAQWRDLAVCVFPGHGSRACQTSTTPRTSADCWAAPRRDGCWCGPSNRRRARWPDPGMWPRVIGAVCAALAVLVAVVL